MENSNKIAVLCNYELLPERVGGMDHFYWLFDKKCKDNGIEVDWFFPNLSTHGGYSDLNLHSSNYGNVEQYFLNNHSSTDYSHIFTHFIELCTPFYKKIKKVNQAKIITIDHNPRPLSGYPLKKRLEKKAKGLLYSRYIDLFVGVSDYTVNEILKDFGSSLKRKSITIYNGVITDTIKERKQRNFDAPTFLVASHLRKSKGIQDLISAVGLLSKDTKRKIVIDVYGDGPYRTKLENQVATLGLTSNFVFKGSVANLNEIYCNYDYMLQPTYMECFSLSILESLAANVPVITTNVGGNEEAVSHGENGIIFKPKDVTKLAAVLEALISQEIKIEQNTRTAIAARFSIETMVENYFKLLP